VFSALSVAKIPKSDKNRKKNKNLSKKYQKAIDLALILLKLRMYGEREKPVQG